MAFLEKEVSLWIEGIKKYIFCTEGEVHGVIFLPALLAICTMMFFVDLVVSEVLCPGRTGTAPASTICVEALAAITWGSVNPTELRQEGFHPQKLLLMQLHHWSTAHLVSNLLCLTVPMYYLERRFGPSRILLLSLAGALFTAGGVLVIPRNAQFAGLSGVCMTMIWSTIIEIFINFRTHRLIIFPAILVLAFILQAVFEIVFFNKLIAIGGHLGGSLAGLLVPGLLLPYHLKSKPTWVKITWGTCSFLVFLLVILLIWGLFWVSGR